MSVGYVNELSETLYGYRKQNFLCDVTIVALGGVCVFAHSLILATASNKLRAAFERTHQGGPSRRPNWGYRLAIADCSVECIEAVLQFVYTGSMQLDMFVKKEIEDQSLLKKDTLNGFLMSSSASILLSNTKSYLSNDAEQNFNGIFENMDSPTKTKVISKSLDALSILKAGQKLGLDPTKLANCLYAMLEIGSLNIEDTTPYLLTEEDIILDLVDRDPTTFNSMNLIETMHVTSYIMSDIDKTKALATIDHCYFNYNNNNIVNNSSNESDQCLQNNKINNIVYNANSFNPTIAYSLGKFLSGNPSSETVGSGYTTKSGVTTNTPAKISGSALPQSNPIQATDVYLIKNTLVKHKATPLPNFSSVENISSVNNVSSKTFKILSTNRKLLPKPSVANNSNSEETVKPVSTSSVSQKLGAIFCPTSASTNKNRVTKMVNEENYPILYSMTVPKLTMVPSTSSGYSQGYQMTGFKNKSNFVREISTLKEQSMESLLGSQMMIDDDTMNVANLNNEYATKTVDCPTRTCEIVMNPVETEEKPSRYNDTVKTSKLLSRGEHVCETCGKSFRTRTEHGNHVRTHTGAKPYQCDICGHSFARRYTAMEHKRLHSGDKPYQCDRCGKRFTTGGDLTKHRRSQHGAVKPHVCSICGKEMSTGREVADHRRLHEGGNRCPVCNKTFTRLHNMKEHLKGTHEGYRLFSCPYCDKQFVYSGSLRFHKKQHRLAPGSCSNGGSAGVLSNRQRLGMDSAISLRQCGQNFNRKVHEHSSRSVKQSKHFIEEEEDLSTYDHNFSDHAPDSSSLSQPQNLPPGNTLFVSPKVIDSGDHVAMGYPSSAIIEFSQTTGNMVIGEVLAGAGGLQSRQIRLEVGAIDSLQDHVLVDLALSEVINFGSGE